MTDELERSVSAPRYALLAGGGSGGHVFPALAIGDELARRGWRVSFAGTATGMEARLVGTRGLDFVPLAARPLVGRSLAGRVAAAATLAGSALRARREIRSRGVDLVIGTGGFASAPAVVGAALARRPSLLVEPNAAAGAANRWLSRLAAGAALAYESTAKELACPSFVSGVPVRDAFFAAPPLFESPLAALAPRLLVLGGSQGSRRLNLLLPPAVALAAERLPALAVVHQCGEKNLDEARELWQAAGVAERVDLRLFIDDVAAAMASATLVVSRAGAITLAEICASGRPSILVPLALAGAHQDANARRLEASGAALRLDETTATPEELATLLVELLAAPARVASMGRAARALARQGAAANIADCAARLTGETAR